MYKIIEEGHYFTLSYARLIQFDTTKVILGTTLLLLFSSSSSFQTGKRLQISSARPNTFFLVRAVYPT
jgi:hypothetical protein